jgi:hypothetical protein
MSAYTPRSQSEFLVEIALHSYSSNSNIVVDSYICLDGVSSRHHRVDTLLVTVIIVSMT